MATITIEIRASRRWWCGAILVAGAAAIRMGANPDRVAAWIVKYGMKIEARQA